MGKPPYLRACTALDGRMLDLLDLDDLAVDEGGRGVVNAKAEAALDLVVAQAKREVREARRRWEMRTRAA